MGTKKVLILSHTGTHSQFKIGSHHYANKMASLGFDVYYSGVPTSILHKLLKRNNNGTLKLNNNVHPLIIDSVLPVTLKNLFINIFINNMFWVLSRKKEKIPFFDFIICDYPYFLPLLSHIKYDKIIYRPTDDYYSMSGSKVVYYERKIIETSDCIICTSEVVKNNLIRRYSNQMTKEIYVIENGYDSELFYTESENIRNGCVYVGALDDRFSFENLRTLSQNFPDIQFDIYGPLDDRNKKIIDLMQNHNVSFKGALEYEDVAGILNKYKVGILPLVKNGKNKGRSPMKLWEYYSCGLNVVYANISHINNDIFFKYDSESEKDICDVFSKAMTYERSFNDKNISLLENSWDYKAKEIINILHMNH